MANIFMYVTDKGVALRHRGTSLWPEPSKEADKQTIKVARLKHNVAFNPEPMAYDRLVLLMHNEAATKVEMLDFADATSLAASGAKVALMTGQGKLNMPADQTAALKAWIEAGGTLVVDAAGGDKDFARAAEEMIETLFGRRSLRLMASSSPIYTLEGRAIDRIKYRRQTAAKLQTKEANLRTVVLNDRPAVIFSPEDMTAALVGYPSVEADGYDPDTAWPLMRNILLYCGSEKK